MFIVRNTFVAKPGCASKLAAQLKEAVAAFQMPGARVMSDFTGDFNRVIMEYTAESLEEFEKRIESIEKLPRRVGNPATWRREKSVKKIPWI